MNRTKAAGNLMLLLLACAIAIGAMGQAGDATLTKEDIIHRAWKAMFGDRRDADIRSIYAEGYFHGRTEPSRMTLKRPNLFRNENPSGVLVFDGRRAAWAKRAPDDKGNPRGPELIEAKYWRHFEVDIAILFPAFFDHPAELKGIEKVNGVDAYTLHVPLPLGGERHLLCRLQEFPGHPKARLLGWRPQGRVGKPGRRLRDHDGILFSDGYSFAGSKGMEKGLYKNVRFNIDPADELFKIPEELDKPAQGL